MSREECLQALTETRLARLACVKENQPYIVPVYISLDHLPDGEPCLYGFTTVGKKVEWMRANPLVCVEVDNVTAYDQWMSVIVMGHYEELHETSGHDSHRLRFHEGSEIGHDQDLAAGEPVDHRLLAYNVLQTQAVWWLPGAAAHVHADSLERLPYTFYRVTIDAVTGHRATPESGAAAPTVLPAPAGDENWLHGLLRFVRHPFFR